MEEKGEMRILQLPMKVLDDLNICERRALLRVEPHLGGKPTLLEELGKKLWSKKRCKYRKLVEVELEKLGTVHHTWLEHNLSIIYRGRHCIFVLNGLCDMVTFISISKPKSDKHIPIFILFEATMYREFTNITDRVIMYASTLYNKYGFRVLPIIVIIKDFEEDLIDRMVIIHNKNTIGVAKSPLVKLERLEKLIIENVKPKIAPPIVCNQCDIEFRKRCIDYKSR